MNGLCSLDTLKSALAGRMSADDELALIVHLDQCESCSAIMEELAAEPAFFRDAAELLTSDDLDDTIPAGDPWSPTDFGVEYLDPSDNEDHLGRLGEYEILQVIGRGGMGVVLKGFDLELKRHVAIKVLAPDLARSSLARRRFAREAQAAAAVVHPHVLAIHQVQPNGRLPFIVMPLIVGESVAERLASQGLLELKEVLRIGMQAAAGLAAAHEQGLVHRDVKPANIMLERGIERALLTDFGLACAADDVAITRWGMIAGTPQYMSPEQARGESLDSRSDLFSLGCVIYEMATGVSPFKADSTIATLRRLVDERPQPMTSLNPELPPWFIRIVERLLEKEPSRRISSASELSNMLASCLAHVQQPSNASAHQLAFLNDQKDRTPSGYLTFKKFKVAVTVAVALGIAIVAWNVVDRIRTAEDLRRQAEHLHHVTGALSRPDLSKAELVKPAPPNPRVASFVDRDTDHDGKLSFAEFSAGRDAVDAERWFDRRDVDHDNSITFDEYFPFSVPASTSSDDRVVPHDNGP
jgi:serine/threonine-protein kinase